MRAGDEGVADALREAGVGRKAAMAVASELLTEPDRAELEEVVDAYLERGRVLAFTSVGDWCADPDERRLEPGTIRLVMLVALARTNTNAALVAEGVGRLFEDRSSDVRMLAVRQAALLGDDALPRLEKRIDEDSWAGVRALATVESWRLGAPVDPTAAAERLLARGSWQPYEVDAAASVFERAGAAGAAAAARLRALRG